ncbi:MAG TPA: hypothetical protein VIK27_10945 [Candidatus Aquilonibacter sp.]
MDIDRSADVERFVRRDALASCPFSAAIERAEIVLRRAHFNVLVVEDFTDTVRRHDAVEFRWHPRLALFPGAQALLTVRPHAPEGTQLQLSIVYVPPLGVVGAWFEAAIGRHIAWGTAGFFLWHLQHALRREARSQAGT